MGILKDHLQEFVEKYRTESPGVRPDVFDLESWTMHRSIAFCPITGAVLVPQQNNGSDCGVFVCAFTNYLSQNLQLRLSAADIPMFRTRLTHDFRRNIVD